MMMNYFKQIALNSNVWKQSYARTVPDLTIHNAINKYRYQWCNSHSLGYASRAKAWAIFLPSAIIDSTTKREINRLAILIERNNTIVL